MASLGGSWTVTPVSMGPECLLCDSIPPVTPLLWPQASSVSAHTPQGPQLTTHARPLVTVPCLGSRAGGTEAGQGFSSVTPMGPRGGGMMIQAWPLPLPLFTQMQAPAPPQGGRLPAPSLSRAGSPIPPDSPPFCSFLPTSIPSPSLS